MGRKQKIGMVALLGVVRIGVAQQTSDPPPIQDMSKLGIEDLMKIDVTTASKQSQSLNHVPAAIYVVTQDDIHRSGATSIPEALRGVPGVQVAQINASQWIVSIRGFGSRYADKLLVLVDGRSIYDPLFSGVFWDAPEVNMDDVDRIEVIRGPGGTLWGANAVNGIINVITKKASETQGSTLKVQTATTGSTSGTAENGGKLGPKAFYRVYAKYFDIQSFPSTLGTAGSDQWKAVHGGFRSDWNDRTNAFTVSGGINSAHEGQISQIPTLSPPYFQIKTSDSPASNWDFTSSWERTSGPGKGASLQVSFDRSDREVPEANEVRNKLNIDFQQPLAAFTRNHVVWGLGYTLTNDVTSAGLVSFAPANRTDRVYSGFVQDEIDLAPKLQLSLGSKVEHNDYSGWEFQPSGRLTWLRDSKQTFWASISRAVRTPNRLDSDSAIVNGVIPPGQIPIPTELLILGNPNFRSEKVLAYELGWRYFPSERFSLDATAFYNRYSDLATITPLAPYQTGNIEVQPFQWVNGQSADTAGFELAAEYQVRRDWRLKSTLTLFGERFFTNPGSNSVNTANPMDTPQRQFSLTSQVDLPKRIHWDTTFNFVDSVERGGIPAYARVDTSLGWHISSLFEAGVRVENLFTTRHREAFSSFIEVPGFIQRTLSVSATLRF